MPVPYRILTLGLCLALTACVFPRKDFSSVPDPSVIQVTRTGSVYQAVPPECRTLQQPSQLNKADDLRMSIAFGCATYTNLAEQVANPQDLVTPKAYRGQSADTAEAAVTRYRNNEVTPLRETTSTDAGAD
ncbi:MAG: CpaD family pilus assembly lipoprotein [Alcaligenaceae bacterium]|nr:CpaD family pilus assembly lipoprotein [Alcaligenaceae bacterium]